MYGNNEFLKDWRLEIGGWRFGIYLDDPTPNPTPQKEGGVMDQTGDATVVGRLDHFCFFPLFLFFVPFFFSPFFLLSSLSSLLSFSFPFLFLSL